MRALKGRNCVRVFRPYRAPLWAPLVTRGDALRACPWLSYSAPLALSSTSVDAFTISVDAPSSTSVDALTISVDAPSSTSVDALTISVDALSSTSVDALTISVDALSSTSVDALTISVDALFRLLRQSSLQVFPFRLVQAANRDRCFRPQESFHLHDSLGRLRTDVFLCSHHTRSG